VLAARESVLPSLRENLGVSTFRAGFMAWIPFSVSQENSIRIAAIDSLLWLSIMFALVIGDYVTRNWTGR